MYTLENEFTTDSSMGKTNLDDKRKTDLFLMTLFT